MSVDPIKLGLLAAIMVAGVVMCVLWFRSRRTAPDARLPSGGEVLVGFGTEFFDTLGIGSFAPTTAIYKLFQMLPDELIPGTLIVGHTPGVLLQSLIFITSVAVAPTLLAGMVIAAAVGAWFGAGIVARLPRYAIQLGMGTALLVAGTVFAAVNLGLIPGGGVALNLGGWKLAVALAASLVLGALMTVGIGMYAPTMILLALLGVHPLSAFPIMMGACALLQPVAGVRFVTRSRFAFGPSLGLTIGGLVGVLLAAFVVKELPLAMLRWLVVVVVLYAALAMLRSVAQSATVSRRP
ncbi:MAG TPA: sulfite exporter TauE/SafE family protein [Steroidobacteraceae bacterium]|nr:sulfite exporter TauE/SafE family protein [Steroidobacteraceae bacterium]